jgi:hypothetical protein
MKKHAKCIKTFFKTFLGGIKAKLKENIPLVEKLNVFQILSQMLLKREFSVTGWGEQG